MLRRARFACYPAILSGLLAVAGIAPGCNVSPGEGPFDTFGTGTEGGETGDTGEPDCEGSALELGDPECDPPVGATDDCIPEPGAPIQVLDPTITDTLPETQEAEIAAAVAPDGTEYVATQILDWECNGTLMNGECEAPPSEPTYCLVQKGIGLYRRAPGEDDFESVTVEPAGPEGLEEDLSIDLDAPNMNSDLRWYTDPYFAISEETGAVYLSVLKWPRLQESTCSSARPNPVVDFDEEVQLWAIAPGESNLKKVGVDGDGVSLISVGLNLDDQGDRRPLDHPRVAVDSLDQDSDRVVVTFNRFQSDRDRFVTVECDFPGGCSVVGAPQLLGSDAISFSNPRFDANGDLYIAHAHREEINPGDFVAVRPEVLHLTWNQNDAAWDFDETDGGIGGPDPVKTYFTHQDSRRIDTPDSRDFLIDVTPAMTIARLSNATKPVVWLAWVTRDPNNNDYGIEIAAANADDLSVGSWTPTVEVPKEFDAMTMRANHWAPELAVDGDMNILDLVNYRADASVGADNVQLDSAIWPRLSRFRAHDLTFVGQASVTANPGMDAPLVADLPGRGPDSTSLFLGEYIGLAQHPGSGFGLVAWNLQRDEQGGLRRSDVAANWFDAECPDMMILDNGTHLAGQAVTTCADPSTAPIGLGTFGTTLASLCEAFPLCGQAENLLVEVSATTTDATGGDILLTSTLEVRQGEVMQADDLMAVLGAGLHTVDMCLTDLEGSPGFELGCIEQPVRVETPLGSGTDSFGHYAGAIASDFVPLASRTGATTLDVGADGVETVPLPSSLGFTFYGEPVSAVTVGANGGLRFTAGSIGPSNSPLPSSASDRPDVAVYWDDLDPSAGGTVGTFFDGRRFIVSWEGVPHASAPGEVSVQAHLYPDGRIEFHFADTEVGDSALDFGASATIGIQDDVDFVQVLSDDPTLLAAGLQALALATDECIASSLVIPPEVSCTAPEIGLTVCASHGQAVEIAAPDVSECAFGATTVTGRVIRSGPSAIAQTERPEPLDITGGVVVLDAGVHTIEWTATNDDGFEVAAPFTQLVHVREWVTGEVCCDPAQTQFVLTNGGDVHFGSGAAECVLAGAGGDVVYAFAGDDLVAGQDDSDVLFGGDDADTLVCNGGDDVAYGGNGPDLATGDDGQDVLTGDGGPDDLDGGADDDVLYGNADADELRGRAGDDVLAGGTGPDRLYPGSGIDVVYGDGDDDEIYLLHECELTSGKALFGGAGYDVLFVPPGITASNLAAAGVLVFGIEDIVELTASQDFASDCAG